MHHVGWGREGKVYLSLATWEEKGQRIARREGERKRGEKRVVETLVEEKGTS